LLAIVIGVNAQTSGCCCNLANATTQADSYLPSTSCLPAFPDFVVPTSTDIILNKTCSTKCGEVAGLPPVPSGSCGSADYKPPPANFSASPLKGTHAMQLTWIAPCAADAYIISRCTGSACSSFAAIGVIGAGTSFIDGSPELKWNTDYTYRIIAKYSIPGDSAPATTVGNTGDIECDSQFTTDSFCISSYYYEGFKTYLQANGYAGSPSTASSAFTSDFATAVNTAFFTKFNKGYSCDAKNKLISLKTCGVGEICVAKGTTPACITPSNCTLSTGIFGLGSTTTTCEGTSEDTKYCFMDKSATPVDACYTCSQALTCYDYKSKSSCERNNCFVGACSWRDTYTDIGGGVCIDDRFNSCPLCNKTSTTGAPNSQAYNAVFDQCSPEKASALSTPAYPCFYSNGQALDCSKATCKDYTPGQCGSPSGGITLAADNSILTPSTDPCGIKVCQYDPTPTIQCRKNADATPSDTFWLDCALTDAGCEKDYFTPVTTLIPVGSAGKYDFLNIRIWEKSNSSDYGHLALPPGEFTLTIGAPNTTTGDRKELKNFLTYFCANALNATACTSFVGVNSTQLNINDLALQDGTKVLFNFTPGWNTLRYYTRDPANNLEIIKSTSIFACTACQGPKVLNYTFTPGNQINGTVYTR
ncbi:MAG: fibronectin type III domain-containing protein, partial [Nanoarchaeota archaeon]